MAKALAIGVAVFVVLLGAYWLLQQPAPGPYDVSYTQAMRLVDSGEAKSAILQGDSLVITGKSGQSFATTTPASADDALRHLEFAKVNVTIRANRPIVLVYLAWFVVVASTAAFLTVAWPASRVLKRLGYSPWTVVWGLIPCGLVVGTWVVASKKWPIERGSNA